MYLLACPCSRFRPYPMRIRTTGSGMFRVGILRVGYAYGSNIAVMGIPGFTCANVKFRDFMSRAVVHGLQCRRYYYSGSMDII